MAWIQKEFVLRPYSRGFHLITEEVLTQIPELAHYSLGMVHLFIRHTSASLCLSECVEPEVRIDLESYFNRIVPESPDHYTHTYEGPDDMPGHIKHVLLGASVTIPISDGRLGLGTWQGVFLCEHRNHARGRRLVVTIFGDTSV